MIKRDWWMLQAALQEKLDKKFGQDTFAVNVMSAPPSASGIEVRLRFNLHAAIHYPDDELMMSRSSKDELFNNMVAEIEAAASALQDRAFYGPRETRDSSK